MCRELSRGRCQRVKATFGCQAQLAYGHTRFSSQSFAEWWALHCSQIQQKLGGGSAQLCCLLKMSFPRQSVTQRSHSKLSRGTRPQVQVRRTQVHTLDLVDMMLLSAGSELPNLMEAFTPVAINDRLDRVPRAAAV